MQRILEDIKTGQFHNIYLLFGTESYLIKQYRDKLKEALIAGGNTMNYHYYEGKDINIPEIIDLAETLPFLAERRVIILENSELFKKGGEELSEYFKNVCDSTFFIITDKEIDKRSKLYKQIGKSGLAVEFGTPDEKTLLRWVGSLLKKEGFRITESDVIYLLDKIGTDMGNIKSELDKLFCFCMGNDIITRADIDEICIRQVNNQIFDMINAVADKKQKVAMEYYYDLLALKEPPMKILSLVSRQFNLLMQVKELKAKGLDNRRIGERIGLPPFIATKYMTQCGKFKMSELRGAVEACVEADEAVKTGRMNDVMSVELLLIQFSS